MTCSGCHRPVPEGAERCPRCGEPMSVTVGSATQGLGDLKIQLQGIRQRLQTVATSAPSPDEPERPPGGGVTTEKVEALDYHITVIEGTRRGEQFPIGRIITFGRAEHCEVRLSDISVSREHCRVVYHPEKQVFLLQDLGSANGSTVNGRVCRKAELTSGDRIGIGTAEVLFHRGELPSDIAEALGLDEDADEAAGTPDPEAEPAEAAEEAEEAEEPPAEAAEEEVAEAAPPDDLDLATTTPVELPEEDEAPAEPAPVAEDQAETVEVAAAEGDVATPEDEPGEAEPEGGEEDDDDEDRRPTLPPAEPEEEPEDDDEDQRPTVPPAEPEDDEDRRLTAPAGGRVTVTGPDQDVSPDSGSAAVTPDEEAATLSALFPTDGVGEAPAPESRDRDDEDAHAVTKEHAVTRAATTPETRSALQALREDAGPDRAAGVARADRRATTPETVEVGGAATMPPEAAETVPPEGLDEEETLSSLFPTDQESARRGRAGAAPEVEDALSDEPTVQVQAMDEPTAQVQAMDEPTAQVQAMDEPTAQVQAFEEPTAEVPGPGARPAAESPPGVPRDRGVLRTQPSWPKPSPAPPETEVEQGAATPAPTVPDSRDAVEIVDSPPSEPRYQPSWTDEAFEAEVVAPPPSREDEELAGLLDLVPDPDERVASDPPEAPQAPPPPPPQPQERRERVEVHLGGAPEPSPAPKGSTRDPVVRSLSRPGSPYPHDEDTDRYVVRQHPIPTPDEETGPHAAVRPVDRGTLWIVAAFFIGGALLAGIWFLWRGLE